MKNVLITGVSSGIGRELTKKLTEDGHNIFGLARRKNLLEELKRELNISNFAYRVMDLSAPNSWKHLIKNLNQKKFKPDVIIFNAAINKNDLLKNINMIFLEEMIKVNFLSIIEGVQTIIEKYPKPLHFIAISTTSSFKGNYREGLGYSASKAALSVAFESLYQKYFSSRIKFSTIFFGPIETDMNRFIKATPFTVTTDRAVKCIIKAMNEKKPFYYYPRIIFLFLKVSRLLPNTLFFKLWNKLQTHYI